MNKKQISNKKYLSLIIILSLTLAVINGIVLYLVTNLIDLATVKNFSKIINIFKVLLVLSLLELIFSLLLGNSVSKYIVYSVSKLKEKYLDEVFKLDLFDFKQNNSDTYLSILTNDVDNYERKFYTNVTEVINIFAKLLISFIILAKINLKLLLVSFVLFAIFIITSKKTSKPLVKSEEKKSKSLDYYTNYIRESVDGYYVIKSNLLEKSKIKKFSEISQKVQNDNLEIDKKSTHIDAFNQFIQFSLILILMIGGIILSMRANLSIGSTILAGSAFIDSIWPMREVSPLMSEIIGSSSVIKKMDQTLKVKENLKVEKIDNLETLVFNDASLGYQNKVVLDNINFSIKNNEKILIVGESGVGKSTILKTIRLLIPLLKGQMLINGIDSTNIDINDFYKSITIVDQEGFIFSGSILENITLFNAVDNKFLNEILNKINLGDLDLDYQLRNNGDNLSGGQKARILLARALYLDSDLIICDEILASLDYSNAVNIENLILSLDKKVINVSHVLFTENKIKYDKIFKVSNQKVILENSK